MSGKQNPQEQQLPGKPIEKHNVTNTIIADLLEGRKMYYKQCEYCGANLDPEEHCRCREESEQGESRKGDCRSGHAVESKNSDGAHSK